MADEEKKCKIGEKLVTSTIGKGKKKGQSKVYCKTTKYVITISQTKDAEIKTEGGVEFATYEIEITNVANQKKYNYVFEDRSNKFKKTVLLRNKEKLSIVRDLIENSVIVTSSLGVEEGDKPELIDRIGKMLNR